MKRLILMRHGKSSWTNPLLSDFERPLNARGQRDIVTMSDRLFDRKMMPELIISSPAKRTKITAEKVAEVLSKKLHFEKDFYNALFEDVLESVRNLDNQLDTVMLVFHNPAITDLRNYFLEDYLDNIPTSGMVGLEFTDAEDWSTLKNGQELFFDYPKKK
ncbi:histidine phosphatase family protein [Flammeovirga pectinis]|uniref:Histidine phosphatase family protein n=2 Tax=Flammeovirga pectinis TaxID=2494373 RepID=A0A3S9P301_9BACT|nr:histidine phosphatase family protein [Flammeovirga pectinis]